MPKLVKLELEDPIRKDLHKIQKLLGHKTPIMTQRYAHHDIESLRDAVEILDKASGGF